MKRFMVRAKYGHCGAKRSTEHTIFLWAADINEAMDKVKRIPGTKKGKDVFHTIISMKEV